MSFKFNPITNRLDLVETSGGGGGDVSGPGSSTNNAIVRWDGITGTLVKDSNVIVSDAGDISANSIDLTVPLDETDGGTGQSSYTTGDILYSSASNTLTKLPIGTDNKVLTVIGGIPSWETPAASGVTSVSGTADRITSTGGTTPVIDIAGTYVGQTSITTLGTIATGIWNGTAVGPTFGGTGLTSYATGDLIYASASNTLSKLATVNNSALTTNSSGVPNYQTAPFSFGFLQWFNGSPVINNCRRRIFWYDDFLGGYSTVSSNTGAGSTAGYRGDVYNSQGCSQCRTGTTAAGVGSFAIGGRGGNTYTITNASLIYYEALVTFDSLGNGTDNFKCYIGLHDGSSGAPDPTNGIYIGYNYSTHATHWQCYTTASSVTTTTDSGVDATITTTWNRIAFLYDSSVPNVKFYINDTLVATHTTNLPSTTALIGPSFLIAKTAGTNDRPMFMDYYIWNIILASDR